MRLSTVTAAKFGLRGLVLSPIRLAITAILAAVGLGLCGAASSAYRFDEERSYREVLFAEDYTINTPMSAEEFDTLNERADGSLMALRAGNTFFMEYPYFLWQPDRLSSEGILRAPGYLSCIGTDFVEQAGVSLSGRLPENREEVAVSSCIADAIVSCGYYDYIGYYFDPLDIANRDEAGGRYVASEEELIGGDYRLTICFGEEKIQATIVGILEDHCSGEHASNDVMGYHDKIFVSEELFASASDIVVYGVADGYNDKLGAFYEATKEVYSFHSDGAQAFFSAISELLELRKVFIGLGIALGVFSVLLIGQLISFSIRQKKGEIAILRALGASKGDVVRIYLLESLSLSLVQSLLGSVLCGILSFSFNHSLEEIAKGIILLRFDILTAAFIFALSLAISVIASVIPIYRTARKSPVDAIRENLE